AKTARQVLDSILAREVPRFLIWPDGSGSDEGPSAAIVAEIQRLRALMRRGSADAPGIEAQLSALEAVLRRSTSLAGYDPGNDNRIGPTGGEDKTKKSPGGFLPAGALPIEEEIEEEPEPERVGRVHMVGGVVQRSARLADELKVLDEKLKVF